MLRSHARHGRANLALRRWAPAVALLLALLLSAALRAPAARASGDTIAVTTTRDVVDGSVASLASLRAAPGPDGDVSLREAMLAAEAEPPGQPVTIAFALTPADPGYDAASGSWRILLEGAPSALLPPMDRGGVTIDATTQPGYAGAPLVIVDGVDVIEGEGLSNGLTIRSAANAVRGLALVNFYDTAVVLDGPGAQANTVAACAIGDSPRGAPELPGFYGVEVRGGASGNTVGGPAAADRNVIVGNGNAGVQLSGAGTTGNSVDGNWVGLDLRGQPLANVFGIVLRDGAPANQVGSGRPNVVSGNTYGIYLLATSGNLVRGNVIGLAPDGTTPEPNQEGGIYLTAGAHDNAVVGNVVGANGGQGLYISGAGTTGNRAQGNYVGVDASGVVPRGNLRQGVLVAFGATGNLIGGAAPGEGNVIGYNGLGGVRVDADSNQVVGNLIGVGADSQTSLGNQGDGVRLGGDGNLVRGNLVANSQASGVLVAGGAADLDGNTIRANDAGGVCVLGDSARVLGNSILANGVRAEGGDDCEIGSGVAITGTGSLVQDNTIHDNLGVGVVVLHGVGNRLLSNSISGNAAGGISLRQGGNAAIAPPTVTIASGAAVGGVACGRCAVEIFSDSGAQGRYLIGRATADGDGSFQVVPDPAAQGRFVTATNTDSLGNTSVFSAAAPLGGATYRVSLPLVAAR